MQGSSTSVAQAHAQQPQSASRASTDKLIAVSVVKRVVGESAVDIWKLYVDFRDKGLPSLHLPLGGIVSRVESVRNGRQARRDLAVLRKYGLMHDVGHQIEEVREGNKYVVQLIYARRVFGLMNGEDFMLVPGDAYAKLKVAADAMVRGSRGKVSKFKRSWGGARKGAGRHRNDRKVPMVTAATVALAKSDGLTSRNSSGRTPPVFKRPPDSTKSKSYKNHCSGSLSENLSRAADEPRPGIGTSFGPGMGGTTPTVGTTQVGTVAEFLDKTSPASKSNDQPRTALGSPGVEQWPGGEAVVVPGLGLTLVGAGKSRPRRPKGWVPPDPTKFDGVPCYPGASVVELAHVPPPPAVDPDAADFEHGEVLAQAYRTAVAHLTGKRCGYLSVKGQLRRWKHHGKLVDGAKLLLKNGIGPLEWALWSCAVWPKKSMLPPLDWVFSPARLQNTLQLRFFEEEAPRLGGQAVWTPAKRDLLVKWQAMQHYLRVVTDPAVARQIAAQHFPDGLYDRLVARARAEAKATEQQLWKRAQRGEWVW